MLNRYCLVSAQRSGVGFSVPNRGWSLGKTFFCLRFCLFFAVLCRFSECVANEERGAASLAGLAAGESAGGHGLRETSLEYELRYEINMSRKNYVDRQTLRTR